MVKYSDANLDAVFAALADPTRRAILARLSSGEARVTELAQPFAMSLPAITKHLGVLERAGLISREKDGRLRRCHLDAGPLREACSWIEHYRQFWETRLDALSQYLEENESKEESDGNSTG